MKNERNDQWINDTQANGKGAYDHDNLFGGCGIGNGFQLSR